MTSLSCKKEFSQADHITDCVCVRVRVHAGSQSMSCNLPTSKLLRNVPQSNNPSPLAPPAPTVQHAVTAAEGQFPECCSPLALT